MYDTKLDAYCYPFDTHISFGCEFSYCNPIVNYSAEKILWHNDYTDKDVALDYCQSVYDTDDYISSILVMFAQESSDEETMEQQKEKARQKRKEICANVCDVINKDAKDGDWIKIKRVIFD